MLEFATTNLIFKDLSFFVTTDSEWPQHPKGIIYNLFE